MAKTWKKVTGAWQRRGYADRPIGGRNDLVYGTYEPTPDTTGTLTDEAVLLDGSHNYNASSVNSVTIPNGAVITSKVIYGDVVFAGSATLNDCLLLGGAQAITSGNLGILSCTEVRTGQAVLTDCTIRPRKSSDGRDGALGMQFELYRCRITGGVDGVGIYNKYGPVANVKVKGCLIDDRDYTFPDRDHADGTHSDGIQIQGGTNIEVIGNAIWGTAHYMPGSSTYYTGSTAGVANSTKDLGDYPLLMSPSRNPGSGIIINGNIQPLDATVKINYNYIHYCKIQLLIKNQADGFQCLGNKLSFVDKPSRNTNGTVVNGVTLSFTANEYWMRLDSLSASPNVAGVTSGGTLVNTTNAWLDGPSAGVALASPRASGIQYDAA